MNKTTKIYGKDKRLEKLKLKINKEKKIPDNYLISGILDSIFDANAHNKKAS